MYDVKIWPDGSWVGEDDWDTIAEDYSDDYFILTIPDDIVADSDEAMEQFILKAHRDLSANVRYTCINCKKPNFTTAGGLTMSAGFVCSDCLHTTSELTHNDFLEDPAHDGHDVEDLFISNTPCRIPKWQKICATVVLIWLIGFLLISQITTHDTLEPDAAMEKAAQDLFDIVLPSEHPIPDEIDINQETEY